MAEEQLDLEDLDENISENDESVETEELELEETEQEEAPEYSETEKQAMAKGWNPEGVEGKRNLTAEEFLDRQPLFDEMHRLRQTLKKQSKAIDALVKHNSTVEERARERALKELQNQKRIAIEEGETDRVFELDNEIDELKSQETPKVSEGLDVETVQTVMRDYVTEWEANNQWYNKDPKLKKYADSLIRDYAAENSNTGPAADEDELRERFDKAFKYMEQEVKETFPEKFMSASKRPSPVANSSRKPTKSKKLGMKDLKTDEDRQIAKTIINAGVPEEKYFSDLEKSGYFD